jgi:hypothetical protein
MHVYFTDHFVNQTITQFFAKSINKPISAIHNYNKSDDLFVSYGILRGTGEVIKERKKNFIYLDHGYFQASSRKFTKEKNTIISNLEGYFRVIKDDLYFNNFYINNDPTRFHKLNLDLKDKKKGEIIILSEPTQNTLDFLNLKNWKEDTISEIKKYSDRQIIVHNKFSETPLNHLLDKAFAFVSCQSTAGFNSIIEGVPAYFTHSSLKKFGSISDIEKNILNHELLYSAANSQWKLQEFFSDEFKQYINIITLEN